MKYWLTQEKLLKLKSLLEEDIFFANDEYVPNTYVWKTVRNGEFAYLIIKNNYVQLDIDNCLQKSDIRNYIAMNKTLCDVLNHFNDLLEKTNK